jgi:hypothetical protein
LRITSRSMSMYLSVTQLLPSFVAWNKEIRYLVFCIILH